jgi:hypothetical protein
MQKPREILWLTLVHPIKTARLRTAIRLVKRILRPSGANGMNFVSKLTGLDLPKSVLSSNSESSGPCHRKIYEGMHTLSKEIA